MVGLLLIALTLAATASALSYVDYSGVKMPHYDGSADYDSPPSPPSEDYQGHSLDVSASLDYKYEEQSNIKTDKPLRNLEDSDMWPQTARKHGELIRSITKRSRRNKHDNYDDDDSGDDDIDEIPKLKIRNPIFKHRSRLKTDYDSKEEILPRQLNKYNRDRKETSNIDRQNYQIDKDYIRDDKIKDFDDDIKFREPINKKSNRRRPRDKQFRKQQKSNFLEHEEELEADKQNISGYGKIIKDNQLKIVNKRYQSADPPILHHRPVIDGDYEEKHAKSIRESKKRDSSYEYEDFYDMKRLNNLKMNLPTLLRRNTVNVPVTNTNLLDLLMANRRLMMSTPVPPPTTTTSSLMTKSLVTRSTTLGRRIISRTTTRFTTTRATTTTKRKIEITEMSLAEKSRLSIMKKAQRKEGVSFHSTKKPPVLLQVTSHMPTVVMVEQPSPSATWENSRKSMGDSPALIQKVKTYMMKKLVADAKDIDEIVEDWDTIVCDYVDTRLFSGTGGVVVRNMCFINLLLYLAVLVVI